MSLLASGTLDAARAADAASMLSPAALARTASGAGVNSQPSSQILASPSFQAQRALSAANLARAAADLSAINAAQAAASAGSQLTLNNVALSGSSWNGTALSGLNPRDGDPTLWIGADALKKDTASATATVKQTASTALLTWQSFDINKGEKLVFDQQGNADWAVLNRVVAGPRGADGSRFVASPSRILGSIEAPGSVYVINPNGVVFGPTAQVNVHSFIASTLDVGNPSMSIGERNSFFLNSGFLGNPGGDIPAESFSYNPADTKVEGDIVVEAGARITASLAPRAISPDAGGFVYLFAPNVTNRGIISTPAGETLMVAAQAVQLIANGYPGRVRYGRPTESVRNLPRRGHQFLHFWRKVRQWRDDNQPADHLAHGRSGFGPDIGARAGNQQRPDFGRARRGYPQWRPGNQRIVRRQRPRRDPSQYQRDPQRPDFPGCKTQADPERRQHPDPAQREW